MSSVFTERSNNYGGNIGNHAFRNCSSLTSITIPDGVTNLSNNAFGGCYNLETAILPKSLKKLGEGIFYDNYEVSIYYKGTKEDLETLLIEDNSSFTSRNIYFYLEAEPTEQGNYWHYIEGAITKW